MPLQTQGRGKKHSDCKCSNTNWQLSRETPKRVTNEAGEICRNPRAVHVTSKLLPMTEAWGGDPRPGLGSRAGLKHT